MSGHVIIMWHKPPIKIVEGQSWYNSNDNNLYKAYVQHKLWMRCRFDPDTPCSIIRMPKGTIYIDLSSGNEYQLGKTAWKIYRIAHPIPASPVIDRSNACSAPPEEVDEL